MLEEARNTALMPVRPAHVGVGTLASRNTIAGEAGKANRWRTNFVGRNPRSRLISSALSKAIFWWPISVSSGEHRCNR
jgi:hypothetical protein